MSGAWDAQARCRTCYEPINIEYQRDGSTTGINVWAFHGYYGTQELLNWELPAQVLYDINGGRKELEAEIRSQSLDRWDERHDDDMVPPPTYSAQGLTTAEAAAKLDALMGTARASWKWSVNPDGTVSQHHT